MIPILRAFEGHDSAYSPPTPQGYANVSVDILSINSVEYQLTFKPETKKNLHMSPPSLAQQ